MNKNFISRAFLILLIIFTVIVCYKLFKPFLIEIFIAAILVSIFFSPYEKLVKLFRGRRHLASIIMCLLIILIVVIPSVNLIIYTAQKSISAYSDTVAFLNNADAGTILNSSIYKKADMLGINADSLRSLATDLAQKSSNWLVSGAANLVKSTTNFIISLLIIVFTMFFFFVEGPNFLQKLMYWTPLSNKYDKELFKKFRDISYSTMVSTFVVAIVQGAVGAIGFMIAGLPAFFAGVLIAFFSLLPYFGSGLIWFPTGIYLLFTGQIWQGIFLLAWGVLVISTIDNVIRAYIIKGKAETHPILIIFSILGGIAWFGFWGVFLGPLIISLAATILHIYELEYGEILEK